MSRAPRTVASPRRFAVTMQCNTLIDLIFVDANTTAEARDQARSKCGDGRVLATRVYRKGMSEAIFDPHGVLAREREAQRERHALSPGERRVLDAQLAVAHLISDVAKDLYTLAESHRRSRDEVPSDFGGPYQRNAQRLDAIANAYDDAAKRVEALLAKLPK
jgi:hypothetical protein